MNVLRPTLLTVMLTLPSAVSPSLYGQTPAATAPAAKLGSSVFKWEDLAVKPTNVGQRRDVTDLPTATLSRFECHVSTLNTGLASHPPHRHPQEEFIILKEGTLDVGINGETQRVGPGSLFFFAANDYHNVQNVGDQPATYLVFNLTTAATRSAPPQGAAAAALPGKLPSSIFDWGKLAVKPTSTGERRDIVDSATVTCANLEAHVTTLKPGVAPHPAHRHPDEELIIVKEGLMEVTINGKADSAGPGSIFFFGSNDEHGLKNIGTTTATYHVIRIATEATPRLEAK